VVLALGSFQVDLLALIVPRPVAIKLADARQIIELEAWKEPEPGPAAEPNTPPVYASLASRGVLIRAGIGYFLEQPIVGHGIGGPEYLLRRDDPLGGVFSLHNWWVDLLTSGGVIGFGLFSWYYLALLR